MTARATSLRRLAKLAVLIPLEAALRALARRVDRPKQAEGDWPDEDAR